MSSYHELTLKEVNANLGNTIVSAVSRIVLRDVGEPLQDVFRAEQPNTARVLEIMLFK